MTKDSLVEYFDAQAASRDVWKRRNWYYHASLTELARFIIPERQSVLELGCGTGDLLASLNPSRGVGIDISENMLAAARGKYPQLEWRKDDADNLRIEEKFDYVVMSDLIGLVNDVEKTFHNLQRVCHLHTRILITHYNYLWEPIVRFAQSFRLKGPQPIQSWLSPSDVEDILYLAGCEIVKKGNKLIFPKPVPIISQLLNKVVANLPILRRLGFVQYYVARLVPNTAKEHSVSVVIPCRNEEGNIEEAVSRLPEFGTNTEIIFVEGQSSDRTLDKVKDVAGLYEGRRNIRWAVQDGKGKGDAVRKGFGMATGDILMILDADLTVAPEDLPKFYDAIRMRKGEFINGSRLVYPMEREAMKFFNILGNKFFSIMFTWLLDQRIKDTLCGTKVLFKTSYEQIVMQRSYFGEFDPFGDFDLLFGAAKLNLKIVELPVRYYARTYGETNIQRWKHGWLLLKMVIFAMKKLKFT